MTIICGGDVKSLQIVRFKSVDAIALQSLKIMVPCMPWHIVIIQADMAGYGCTLPLQLTKHGLLLAALQNVLCMACSSAAWQLTA